MASNQTRLAIRSQVALLLRNERLRQKLSLNALAQRAGLSRQMISFIEQEERNPTLDTLLRITEVLELKIVISRVKTAHFSRVQNHPPPETLIS